MRCDGFWNRRNNPDSVLVMQRNRAARSWDYVHCCPPRRTLRLQTLKTFAAKRASLRVRNACIIGCTDGCCCTSRFRWHWFCSELFTRLWRCATNTREKNVARTRTTKKLAQRIDLNYFKRPTPLKHAKFWLSALLPLLAMIWISWRGFVDDHRVYSRGRLSPAHAILEKECSACHMQKAEAFSSKATDSACLGCHDGPAHHVAQISVPKCAWCHDEHRGRINITAATNQACAECHSHLKASRGAAQYASHIRTFEDGHPEFAALRSVESGAVKDPGTIKLNHAIHMKPIRSGPNGPIVQLQCGNCHRATAGGADLTYADPKYRAATVSYKDADEFKS